MKDLKETKQSALPLVRALPADAKALADRRPLACPVVNAVRSTTGVKAWRDETKGREDVDVKLKDKRAEEWCKQVSKLTGKEWSYKRVDQARFEKGRFTRLVDLV